MESVGTADRKFLIAPWLIPSGVAAQAVFRIIDAVFESVSGRFQSTAGFEVDAADFNGAWAFFMAKRSVVVVVMMRLLCCAVMWVMMVRWDESWNVTPSSQLCI